MSLKDTALPFDITDVPVVFWDSLFEFGQIAKCIGQRLNLRERP